MLKKIIIVGAGPAGLTAALELQKKGFKNIKIFENDKQVGGISKTVNHNGNRIDIGGHRFFSKSKWVMKWWTDILPIEKIETAELNLEYKGKSIDFENINFTDTKSDKTMIIRNRLSRIYFNKNFFDYPLKLNLETIFKIGIFKTVNFGISYIISKLNPKKPEKSLEDFFINRFGVKLYYQFFKEYTEKVWGKPCSEISSSWGAQRIKSLSIKKAIVHALKNFLRLKEKKTNQTSLIESFIYPKLGPGQMWEEASKKFIDNGGEIYLNTKVVQVNIDNNLVNSVITSNEKNIQNLFKCDELISTMPIIDLINYSKKQWTEEIISIANNLNYRDFITVGLLYDIKDFPKPLNDNWIYIQDPGVEIGRVQIFNNWSPHMVSNKNHIWLGLEYFCNEIDQIWNLSNQDLINKAKNELYKIGIVSTLASIDEIIIKVPKAYPGYFGESFKKFDQLRKEVDQVSNLSLIGRNGMHRYNNQDHSMLTAKEAVEQIVSLERNKEKIWSINIDDEYIEENN